jgi:uncharacterized repeat protein (TIGR03803 family)
MTRLSSQPTAAQSRSLLSTCASYPLLALALCLSAQPASALTQSTLYNFAGGTSDGCNVRSGVTFDSSGNLYGTTAGGGSAGAGTIYKLAPSGASWTESVLYNFRGGVLDGKLPNSGVLVGSLGKLYGTTVSGGQTLNNGTFYEITPGVTWTETGLFSFPGGAGGASVYDYGKVIQDSSGNFYGTTYVGGGPNSQGTVWKMTLSGVPTVAVETVLYSFNNVAGHNDGVRPIAGSLVMDSSGNIYGTTVQGGTNNVGTVFELSPPTGGSSTWTEQVIWNFGNPGDGSTPYAGLAIDASGNLYGTTTGGGTHNVGMVFEMSKSSGVWLQQRSYSFGAAGDGSQPYDAPVLDSSGNVYGTTRNGGAHSWGTVFKLVPNGPSGWSESVLYSLTGGTNGAFPYESIALDSSGNIYSTTNAGGTHACGLVFKIVP